MERFFTEQLFNILYTTPKEILGIQTSSFIYILAIE